MNDIEVGGYYFFGKKNPWPVRLVISIRNFAVDYNAYDNQGKFLIRASMWKSDFISHAIKRVKPKLTS